MKHLFVKLGFGSAVCLAFIFGSVGVTHAKDVKITKRSFKYGNMKYWRVGAQNVRLGTCGNKRTSYGIEVDHHMDAKSFNGVVSKPKHYTINWSKDSDFTTGASLQYVSLKAGGSYARKVTKGAQLKLVHINVAKGDLKNVINSKEERCLSFMRENKNGRVVSSVWVVLDADLAESVTSGGSVNVSGITPNGMELSGNFSGSSTQSSKVTIPKGAIFAYMLHKASKWNKTKKKKTTIKDMKDDQVGLR